MTVPELVAAVNFGAQQPEVVHVLAAVGVEAGYDGAGRALALDWAAAGTRARDLLRYVCRRIVEALSDVKQGTAFACSDVDGSADASSETTKRMSGRAVGVVNGCAATAAGSFGQTAFLAEGSIRTHGGAFEPCLVVIFAGLHVKSDTDKAGITERVGRRPAAAAAAEVARRPFAAHNKDYATAVAIVVTIPVSVAVPILKLIPRSR
jgi:hypothetical protein